MFDRDELNDQVLITVTQYLEENEVVIGPDTLLEDDLELDSTEIINVFVDLEKRLDVDLKGIRFGDLDTFDDLVDAIAARLPLAEPNVTA